MYRRFPKLKGIAGGMGAGKPKFVTVNVGDLEAAVQAKKLDASAEITIEALKSAGVIKATGYYRNLPLKVLGEGEVSGLKVKAAAFSQSAVEKLSAAGGSVEVIEARPKWSREAHEAAKAA
jgi:large subunit ribosomal protein L15